VEADDLIGGTGPEVGVSVPVSNHSVMAGDKGDPDSQESTQPSAAAGTETPTSGPKTRESSLFYAVFVVPN
jgi:hypothetical protein